MNIQSSIFALKNYASILFKLLSFFLFIKAGKKKGLWGNIRNTMSSQLLEGRVHVYMTTGGKVSHGREMSDRVNRL